jgi:hypothetical protein
MNNISEKEIQSACNRILTKLGIVWLHLPQGRRTSAILRGLPDLLFFSKGKCFAYELKIEGKKPTHEQSEMLMVLATYGGVVTGWGTSVEMFEGFLKINGVIE